MIAGFTEAELDICYKGDFSQAMTEHLPPYLFRGTTRDAVRQIRYAPPHMDGDESCTSVLAKMRAQICITILVAELLSRLKQCHGENPPMKLSDFPDSSNKIILLGMPPPQYPKRIFSNSRNAAYGWPEIWKSHSIYIADTTVIKDGKPSFVFYGMWLTEPISVDWDIRKDGVDWIHSVSLAQVQGVRLSEI